MLIGYREAIALRLASWDGHLYVTGYGIVFEAAMVCEKLGLLEQNPDHAFDLAITARGREVLAKVPSPVDDGWTLEVS